MQNIKVGTCIPGENFEKWVPTLKDKGFECFSVNFHMSFHGVDPEKLADYARALLSGTGIGIDTLGFYCNPLQNAEQESALHRCVDLAEKFGANTVSTFAGACEGESVEQAMPQFRKVFSGLCRHAEDKGVRLAIENCPMGGTWRKNTCNIGFHPRAWDMMFNEVDSPALGLEWEPAHQMYQLIDPIANLRKYAKKVVHMHGKDAVIRRDLMESEGIWGREEVVVSRFPGFGDTDFRKIFAILQSAGYAGSVSIEGYHDPLFTDTWEYTGQLHALNYLKWCRGGSFAANPWDTDDTSSPE